MESNYAITVVGLSKVYPDVIAVDGISFSIKKGEIFAFLGPNGAGKTTTVEMLVCLRKPTNGNARVLGYDVTKEKLQIKKRIGVLPQSFNTYDKLTVKENIEYFADIFNKKVDINHLLGLVDLEEKANTQFRHLSGGLKQRLGIAVALVNDPEIVFLDEPTSGLDPKSRQDVWRLIKDLHNKGKTVFLTTHYMEEAEVLADRVGIIHKGKIVALDKTDTLIAKYGKKNMLVLKNADSKAVKVIKAKGVEAKFKEEEKEVVVYLNHKLPTSEVLQELTKARVYFKEMQLKRSSLEDVFLNLTGEELEKHEA
jgi:ABC-2 type transport system ATP-binding protein